MKPGAISFGLRGAGRLLGLAFGQRSVSVAEVAIREEGPIRTAEYSYSGDFLEDPAAFGNQLREFLRRGGFRARRAAVGVPARWLLARSRKLPPMAASMAPGAIRLQAEREFSLDVDALVLDFAGTPNPSEPWQALLLGLERRRLEAIVRACRQAGLKLVAVSPSALAAMSAAGEALHDGLLVAVGEGSAELLLQKGGLPLSLRPVAWNGAKPAGPGDAERSLARLAEEIRRFLFLVPGARAERGLLLDGVGLGSEAAAYLGGRAGIPVAPYSVSLQGTEGQTAPCGTAAVPVALAGARRDRVFVDFLRPRCAPPKERRITRRTLLIAAFAAILASGAALLLIDVERRAANLASLQDRLLSIRPDVEEAEAFVKNNKRLILGWYDARPRPLEILKQLTLAFPERGTVWATNVSLSENGKGTLSGKATDQKSVLAVLDRLKSDHRFTEVMLSDMREASGSTGTVSFALTFTFQSVE